MKTLSIALSEQCNLNCSYCNVDKKSKKRIDAELFLEQFRIMREQNPTERIQIDFYGGEPLLQFDLIQKIIEQTSIDGNVQYTMPTNGLLLTNERLEFLQKYKVAISLSFDGLWQDKNRLQLNGKSTQQKYLDRKEFFQSIENLRIHSMIYRGNYNLLENHLYILRNFNINPDLTLVRDIGTWTAQSVEKVNAGITELFDWYKANADTEDMPNLIREYLKHVLLYKLKKHENFTCGASETFFAFSENKLVPCNRFKDEPEVIAKIPVFKHMSACQTCEVKHYCKKGCLYEQIKNDGPIEELCTIYKHIYAEIFKMMAELKGNENFVKLVKEEINREI